MLFTSNDIAQRYVRFLGFPMVVLALRGSCDAQSLANLVQPKMGRSMRSTSTQLDNHGGYAHGNSDNSRVAAGATKVVLDAQGPGVVTHMWPTFLGKE